MTASDTRFSRRGLLGGAAAIAGGTAIGLNPFTALSANGGPPLPAAPGEGGYGPLRPVRDRRDGVARLALPAGFAYLGFGFEGDRMSDGNATPKAHDGMAALPMANGNVRLIRNHEDRDDPGVSPLDGSPDAPAYDPLGPGGTTSLEIRQLRSGAIELVRDFVSLQGTIVNCAGGPTPWGSWLTCEETTQGRTAGWRREHGYVFDVPGDAEDEITPVPLRAMGRFVHEAVAVDPRDGTVYETEDAGTSSFYRFIPNRPGNLRLGGRLQALAIKDRPNYDTRTGQRRRPLFPVTWVDIPNPDPADAEANSLAVFEQGQAGGAAIFARLEGCWYGDGAVYFNSTSGGDVEEGQVWEYRPIGPSGTLRLVFESPAETVLDNPDNITVSPGGAVLLCEDGDLPGLYMRGLTKRGRIFDFAQNLENSREWCGATFSPDGKTLFANIQGDTSTGGDGNLGMTFAITGPFENGAL